MLRYLFSVLVSFALFGVMTAYAASVSVTSQKLAYIFVDQRPYTGVTPDGKQFIITHFNSGKSKLKRPDGSIVSGLWSVKGGKFCTKWANAAENCFNSYFDGAKYLLRNGNIYAGYWLR